MRPTRRFHRTLSLGRLSLAVGWELYREPSWDLYVRLRLCLIPPAELRCNPVGGVHALWCPDRPDLPIHRTEAGYPNCSTCDGGGCYDCTDPA